MISLLGTLKLAYIIFYPSPSLLSALKPAADVTGLAPTTIIAAMSSILIIGIFSAAAVMKLVEERYLDKTKKQFEIYLTESAFKTYTNYSNWNREAPSKLGILSRLANNTINALSLAAILIGTWCLILVLSPLIAIAMILCASLVFGLVLYSGSRARRKSAELNIAREELNAALGAINPRAQKPAPDTAEAEFSPEMSLVRERMQAAHDARSRITKFRARLDSIVLISTGTLVGIAILMMIDVDVVYVILTLLLVRFFLNDGRALAGQLQKLSDELDALDWARVIFSNCVPAK